MKNFVVLLFSFCLLFAGSVLMAQQPDSISVDPVTIPYVPIEQTTVYFYMLAAALMGTLTRVFVSVIKGIKTNPNSPDKFSAVFYAIDNFSQKIKVILSYLLSFGFIAQFKLTETLQGTIILCVVAALCGWFIDWLYEWVDKIKIKFNPAKV